MVANVGSKVHPRYKGCDDWEVRAVAELSKLLKWEDDYFGGEVSYSPRLLWLTCKKIDKALWFAYWISNPNTRGKLAWGQGPPVLEEDEFLALITNAIKQGFFTENFLNALKVK